MGRHRARRPKVVSALGKTFVVRDFTLLMGASVGVTMFPDPADTYESVVSRADSAMYQAKAADGASSGRFQSSRASARKSP